MIALIRSASGKAIRKMRRVRSPMPVFIDDRRYRALCAQPSFTEGRIDIFGQSFAFSDKDGFLHSLKEIFVDEVYKFASTNAAPHIIDAGANIGLSVLYFKRLFPNATIVAYEPDPQMFKLLNSNVGGMPGVELRNTAAWTEDTILTFFTEGSLAGSSEVDFLSKGRAIAVPAERLRNELVKRPVEFLKIDIEGAENSVIFDIADQLDQVRHFFFEYHSPKGRPQRLGEMLDLVRAKGFRYFISGAHTARLPFIETMERGFDLQLNVSCARPL